MSWTKHFSFVGKNDRLEKALKNRSDSAWYQGVGANNEKGSAATAGKYSSYLPEYYAGSPQRLDRYKQYDIMDADSEVNSSLDVIADFSTQEEEQKETPFNLNFTGEVSESETLILNDALKKWTKLNEFYKRLWPIFRSTIKYGDCFFVRDPETFKWLWVDQSKVQAIVVNAAKGKVPTEYIINGIDFKIEPSVLTEPNRPNIQSAPSLPTSGPVNSTSTSIMGGSGVGQTVGVKADSMVHLSLSEGLDSNWPFGNSILESVYKVYKQKELLEDSIIIYRVQRAPERRVFYIDVGEMPTHKAMAFVERIKNEIHQKRIPNRTGGGASILDASYNPMCIALDTPIPLLDGRTLTLTDLITEYEQGKENWVYSCDPVTGKIVPGPISWAGVTRRNAQVLRLHLDNGKTLTVTPDHKIPVLGKGFVEAQYLTENDSLISYETRFKSLSGDKDRSYQQVYDHETNKWVFTHRMVGEYFRDLGKHQEFTFSEDLTGALKNTVHHKDYNRYNNDPRNLAWMNDIDHRLYHSLVKKEYWEQLSTEEGERIRSKIRTSLEETRANFTEADKKRISEACSTGQVKRWSNTDRYSEEFQNYRNLLRDRRNKLIASDRDFYNMLQVNIAEQQQKPWPNVQFNWTQDMLQQVVQTIKQGTNKRIDLIQAMNDNQLFMQMLKDANPIPEKGISKVTHEFTDSKLKRLYSTFGYKNFKDLVKKTGVYNHRITKIEWLEALQDTGCITVDANERWHNYHTFATGSEIFIKNSMLEDYFFAQTPEGRGSKVETLPGGENLGDIDDLKYFDNKLKRGLGVPSSYLPSGPEEGTATYNDGKVGTAYIQEYRFAQYCKRLQMLMVDTFDREFKLYLKKRQINIDSGMFEVRLAEPQGFSKYRQIEIDSAQINIFQPLSDVPYLSKRFLLQRYLNLTEDEILENERLWKEENKNKVAASSSDAGGADVSIGLDSVGVRPPADMDFESEFGGEDPLDGLDGEIGDAGGSDAGTASPISGTEPPAT